MSADEFLLDTPVVRAFVTDVRGAIARAGSPQQACDNIRPHFALHRVRTTSAETSVSIQLLTNDTGCVWRHAYDPDSGEQTPFRSGYVNVACETD